MVVFAYEAGGANGIYQLPDAIVAGGFVFLWCGFRNVRKIAAVRTLLCCGCYLDIADYL